jgi:probable lipoprotein NlpC
MKKLTLWIALVLLIGTGACRRNRIINPDREGGYSPPPSRERTESQRYSSRAVNNIIATARSYYGVPYRTGGNDASGFDCSGLLCSVFKSNGFTLPRISWQQASTGREVSMSEIQEGDLLFFVTNKNGGSINHSGLVTEVHSSSEILFIHASSSKGVREDNLFNNYWKTAFVKAVRPF